MSLDPARRSARVTREIAGQLADWRSRWKAGHRAEDVAQFLMRCLFTMFAEDVSCCPRQRSPQLLASSQRNAGQLRAPGRGTVADHGQRRLLVACA